MNKFLAFVAVLLLPVIFASFYFSGQWSIVWPTIGLVLLTGLGFWLCNEEKKRILTVLLRVFFFVIYFLILFVFLFELALIDFSGRGFTDEVFFHMEWESVRIGLNDYFWVLLGFAALVILYVFFIKRMYKNLPVLRHRLITVVLLLGLSLVVVPYSGFSRLYNSAIDFVRIDTSNLDDQRIKQFVELGVMQNNRITLKINLQAETTPKSKNLILIYLESGSFRSSKISGINTKLK